MTRAALLAAIGFVGLVGTACVCWLIRASMYGTRATWMLWRWPIG